MGTKEEMAKPKTVTGFHGQLTPAQTFVGKCKECKEPVFFDPCINSTRSPQTFSAVIYVHHGCKELAK